MSPLLELRDLECVRGSRLLFSGISASVRSGQMLRVRGENGSGKTSLLRMACGLSTPDRGEVLWQGEPVSRRRDAFNAQLVYLGHAPALKDDLSAIENLQASAGLAGWACSEHEAGAALAQAGLRGRERLPVRVLSQGQRKRAVIARLALAAVAPLWVLDEPFNALDEAACAWLHELVDAHLDRGGVVVLTSHLDRDWGTARPQISLSLPAAQAETAPSFVPSAEPA